MACSAVTAASPSMSYEWRKPSSSRSRALSSASPMVWPATNCSPIRRMAMLTPVRIKGSPPRPIRRTSAADRPCSLLVAVNRPVSIKPQVAAFTNSDGLWPRWARQSPPPILSRIRASRVSSSGMRSSASARHISATPSWLDSAYSWISPSTPPDGVFSRSASTSCVASVAGARSARRRQLRLLDQRRQAFGLGPPPGRRDSGPAAGSAAGSTVQKRETGRTCGCLSDEVTWPERQAPQ